VQGTKDAQVRVALFLWSHVFRFCGLIWRRRYRGAMFVYTFVLCNSIAVCAAMSFYLVITGCAGLISGGMMHVS